MSSAALHFTNYAPLLYAGKMQAQHELERKKENFPVASWFLPKKHRYAILALYDFARGADELADNTYAHATEKKQSIIALTTAMHQNNTSAAPEWARPFMALAIEGKTTMQHGHDLLAAFTRDCEPHHCETWEDMLEYCRYSAVPVGRALLELCHENNTSFDMVDAMSTTLQLLDHLQDVKEDYITHKHIYLPQSMLHQYGVTTHMLQASYMSAPVRALYNDILRRCEILIASATKLPSSIACRTLRIELQSVWYVIVHLHHKLYMHDAFAKRVKLTRAEYSWCIIKGIIKGWYP